MEKELGLGIKDITKVKEYWDRRPCNIRHSNKEVGTFEFFEEVSDKRYKVEPHIKKFANFEQWRDKKVLEIGCGIGTDACQFIKYGAHYTGLDLSSESLRIANDRFNVYNYHGTLHETNAENLDFLPHQFDLIYSFGVIHHTPNPRKIIENAYKVLKDDGEIRIMLYAKNSWKSIMIEGGFDQPEAQFGCPIAYSYDEADVNLLFKDLFKINSIEQAHIFPYIIEDYKKNNYIKEKHFENMPEDMFQFLCKKLGWHLLIVAKKK